MLMFKRLFLVIGILLLSCKVIAEDDLASNFMLMNNYDMRQSDDIWSRIRAGFQLDHDETSRVKYFERLYTKNPRRFEAMMATAAPYLYYLLTEIERRGMPTELVFIPGIESSFNPLVTRPDDAYAGMWQFIPSTGKRFNMLQNSGIDERRDIVKSTRAALNYLNYLHSVFVQWDIAIGAYNWGEGGIYRAILDSGQKIGHVKYSDLNVRQITLDYEPKMIALANIIANPSKFGVSLQPAPNQPYFAIVHPATPIPLDDMAKVSQANSAVFNRLNGQYKSSNYQLALQNHVLLPLENQTVYYASIGINTNSSTLLAQNDTDIANSIPEEHVDPSILLGDGEPASYGGETKSEAAAVAAQLASIDAIDMAANHAESVAPAETATINNVTTSGAATTTSNSSNGTVTLASATPATTNQKMNDLIDNIGSDSNTEVHDTGTHDTAQNSTAAITRYTVVAGDTLYSIARRFKVAVNDIKRINKIPGNNLVVGQTIVISKL